MAAGVTKEQFIGSSICQRILEDPRLFDSDKCRVSRTDALRYAIFSMPDEEIEIRFKALLKLQGDFNVSVLEAPCLNANLRRLSPNLYSDNVRNHQPGLEITVEHSFVNKMFTQLKNGEIDYISITTDPDAPVVAGQDCPGASGGIFLHNDNYCIHSTEGRRLFYELDSEQSLQFTMKRRRGTEKQIAEGRRFTRLDELEGGSYAIYLQNSSGDGPRLYRMFTINIDREVVKEPEPDRESEI